MNKIKNALNSIWGWVVAGVLTVVGLLVYIIQAKQKKINALNAKVELADTQKKADLIEVEIKQHLNENATLDKEIKELNKSLELLEQRRKDIAVSEKNKTSNEIEEFWKKN